MGAFDKLKGALPGGGQPAAGNGAAPASAPGEEPAAPLSNGSGASAASGAGGSRGALAGLGSALSGGTLLRAVALAVVGVLLIAGVVALVGGDSGKTLTADFPRTVSIYEGSDVRVLGVAVGEVTAVEPAGTTVKVTMTYDEEIKVPADAKAAVIAPSVVGDRYVQLMPAYQRGPVLEDNATLDIDRTAVPLELDEIYQGLDDLAVSLGPRGANSDGALSRLLASTARNFGGQGKQFNETIRNLSRFTGTLDGNKEALFSTAEQIQRFVGALAENDQTVRDFNDSLASAAGVLEDERDDLAAALRNLGVAMEEVSAFVKDNDEALSRNVKGLVRVTDVLVKQRDALDETLSAAPVALSNLFHTYNPRTGTLDTRSNLSDNIAQLEENPLETLCGLVRPADPTGGLCDQITDALPTLGRAAPGRQASQRVVVVERIDTTLAGLVAPRKEDAR